MPAINRIRIVNFSFNNNKRHIIDETFNFYDGENALLSLVNGGGKSVLVQAFLQPVLPKVAMLGRKFPDFFSGRKTPSYIMIEWKLDNQAGYLLTGMAVTARVSYTAGDEEESTDIRFFTFLNEYDESNDFDIKHVPVTEQQGNSVKIARYDEFRKLLQRETAKNSTMLFLYESTREDQSRYSDKIASYGIFKDEWKELILNINQHEHGVSEVFSECKTSRKVMEQWVIKYIEKVLDKSAGNETSDHKKLETMMIQVARDYVDKERDIRDFELIGKFTEDIERLQIDVIAVLNKLDKEESMKKEICSAYHVLKKEKAFLENEIKELEGKLAALDKDLMLINDEERSFEIYKYQEEILELDRQILGKEQFVRERSLLLEEEKKKLVIQQAAKHFSMIKEKKGSIAQLKQRLENASKDREKLLKEMNKVAYTLKILYGRDLDKLRKEKFEAQSGIDRLRKERDEVTGEALRLDRELNDLNLNKGRFEEKINAFKAEEIKIFDRLGLKILRNPFLGELDKVQIDEVKIRFEEDCISSNNFLSSTRQDDLDFKEKIEKLREEVQTAKDKETGLKLEREKMLSSIGDYEADRNKLEKILRRLNIGLEYIFDKEHILKYCKEELDVWENKVFNLRMEIGEIEKQIKSFERGVSYIPVSLIMKMEEMNIPCYTGEKFLTEINDERRIELIEKNPYLPYALIATQKEIDAIERLVADMELSQIVPVIHINLREKSFDADLESIRFVTGAKKMSLDDKGLKAFMIEMNEKSEQKKQALSSALDVAERVAGQYKDIMSFRWTKIQVDELKLKEQDINDTIKENDVLIKSMHKEIRELQSKREALSLEIERLRDMCNEYKSRVGLFEEYLKKNGEYENNVHLFNLLRGDIEKKMKEKERCGKAKNKLDTEIDILKTTAADASNRISSINDKLMQVNMSKEDEPDEEDVSILEGKLRAYKSSQTGEVEDIRERMEDYHRDVHYLEEEISRLKPDTQEYMHVTYSKNIENGLEEHCNKLNTDIGVLKEEINGLRVKKEGITGSINGVRKALQGRDMIPVEEVRGEFSQRRIHNKKNKEEVIDKKGRSEKEERIVITNIAKIETEIKDIADIPHVQTGNNYSSVKALVTNYLKEYGDLKRSADEQVGSFRKKSSELSAVYVKSDSDFIKDVVKRLKESFDDSYRSYGIYFHLSEKMDAFLNKLKEVLKIVENKIRQLELSRNDLTEHAFMEARRIYREIPKISENSAVEIDGARKKVLEILYEEMGDELQAKEKMSTYIRESLDTITSMIKGREDESKMRREIEKFMSTKELLNIISNLEMCKIRAYKVDLNEKNRSMMLWEDIIVKNSGGEKFVAYFSLLVALISYSRKQTRGYEPFDRTREAKVLIMDNPFGPITSGHLLKPMFDIARKYDTQLICLSDIKQRSVLNSFDLIYMIKIKQNMNMEDYLELEPVMQKELRDNEKLENSYFYHEIKQMSLFE